MIDKIQLGKNLKAERSRCDKTLKDVSEYLNMTLQGYRNYEDGLRIINAIDLKKLATLYNVDINVFYYTNN